MSLLLLFSGDGDVEDEPKKDGFSAYEYRSIQARLHREDQEILEVIIAHTIKGN